VGTGDRVAVEEGDVVGGGGEGEGEGRGVTSSPAQPERANDTTIKDNSIR
jgi:hypothetical protein